MSIKQSHVSMHVTFYLRNQTKLFCNMASPLPSIHHLVSTANKLFFSLVNCSAPCISRYRHVPHTDKNIPMELGLHDVFSQKNPCNMSLIKSYLIRSLFYWPIHHCTRRHNKTHVNLRHMSLEIPQPWKYMYSGICEKSIDCDLGIAVAIPRSQSMDISRF